MTHLKRNIVLILLFFSIATGAIIFKHSKDVSERSKLNSDLDIAINNYKEGKAPFIDIANFNYFSWNQIYIFGPYGNCEHIIKTLDAPSFWIGCKLSGVEDYESISLWVFTENGFVKRYVTSFVVDVRGINHNIGYSHKDARFVLNERGWMILADDN